MMLNFLATGATLPFVYRPMPVEHLGLLALMSFLGFIATVLVIEAYRTSPAVIVAPMQYSQIVWAAFYGYLFFNEGIDLPTLIGTSIIVASGIYIVLREGQPNVSENRPVLQTQTRAVTANSPRGT
jgi:S-adenosylmethionine uptake transporter